MTARMLRAKSAHSARGFEEDFDLWRNGYLRRTKPRHRHATGTTTCTHTIQQHRFHSLTGQTTGFGYSCGIRTNDDHAQGVASGSHGSLGEHGILQHMFVFSMIRC